jgi:hypothetical protein
MKAFADIVAGLWSALCIAAEVTWDYGVKLWSKASDTQKSLILCVVIVVVALSVARVASAENAPDSNFGGFATEDGRVIYMCYTTTNEAQVGIVYTCLITYPIAPGALATQGAVSFCTITSYKDDRPFVDCGEYADITLLSGGI